ncbi:MAG: LysR family transcriptional regulator [Hyphomicrobiaceae bacterium]|nr:MAG: LysR family transcriptional regulator [Hyphomicrobiaceae bacterium]
MEMHQIRYFLAVSRTLNFTRAAEECHVAQPSLTRAIKLLEEELGGDLFRRERNLSHLTELGQRMLPLMQQCYESALSAKSLATSIKTGTIAPVRIALSRSIGMELVIPYLTELTRAFRGLELKFQRGNGPEVAEYLKRGDVDLAIAGPLGESWERLDVWPLFAESFALAVDQKHRLAGRNTVDLADLREERFLIRSYCEQASELSTMLRGQGITLAGGHQVANESDLAALLASNAGVAIVPMSTAMHHRLKLAKVGKLDLRRTVAVYAVAGRERSPAVSALIKLLRAGDWSGYGAA